MQVEFNYLQFLSKQWVKKFEVFRTCRDSIIMATIYVVMVGQTVYEYLQCGKHMYMYYKCVCINMQSNVNIRCHLETFQALSTNFWDSPRTFGELVSNTILFLWLWRARAK